MAEVDDMRRSMIAASQAGSRLFRNNVGQGVVGNVSWPREPAMVHVGPGDAVVRHARVFHAGLCEGSSDLVGTTPLLIQERHVGLTIGVSAYVEQKKLKGKKGELQVKFIDAMNRLGAIAGFAYSPEQTVELLRRFEA